MRYIKVIFDNGDFLHTSINGQEDEIIRYYVGTLFELDEEKPLVKCVSVEFII